MWAWVGRVHLFNKYLLSTYCEPGYRHSTETVAMNKQKFFLCPGAEEGERTIKGQSWNPACSHHSAESGVLGCRKQAADGLVSLEIKHSNLHRLGEATALS